jgi:hypothetical protein
MLLPQEEMALLAASMLQDVTIRNPQECLLGLHPTSQHRRPLHPTFLGLACLAPHSSALQRLKKPSPHLLQLSPRCLRNHCEQATKTYLLQ